MTKRAIVTGGTAGIGFEIVQTLLHRGYSVAALGRNPSKLNEVIEALPNKEKQLEFLSCDFSDLNQVSEAANYLKKHQWDVLINNAGAKVESPKKQTVQGFEWHTGVNHLAHFYLTSKIWDAATDSARMLTVSSIVARTHVMTTEHEASMSTADLYAKSKRENLLFGLTAARKLQNTKQSSTVAHPGFTRASRYGASWVRPVEYLLAQPARRGSETVLRSLDESNGSYIGPAVLELWGRPKPAKLPMEFLDETEQNKFWKETEEKLGIQFRLN